MKVELRDLKQTKWTLEVEPTTTIEELKSLNATEKQLDESVNQRLIFSGKILKDVDTLESIKYVEGKGYIVCMVSKKPAPKKASPAAASTAASKEGTPATPAAPATANASTSQPSTSNSVSEASKSSEVSAPVEGPSAFAIGHQLEVAVNNIMEMGYPRAQVLYAMRKAYNNPDRAVEYLVTGEVPEDIPEEEEEEDQEDNVASRTLDSTNANVEPSSDVGENGANLPSTIDMNLFDGPASDADQDAERTGFVGYNFKELLGISDEDLLHLKEAAIESPESLIRMLQPRLSREPQIANFILANMDEFLAYIDSAGEPEGLAEYTDGPESSGATTIQITEEEDAAIRRLMELGFARHIVAAAYLACDKDEMLTANYLLEHGDDL